MIQLLHPLLAHAWGGVTAASFLCLGGAFLVRASGSSSSPHRPLWRALAWLACGTACVMLAATLWAAAASAVARASRPPPGVRIDVGGFRMHILAEGGGAAGPSVVWIPDWHAQGLALHHLHLALRDDARSILFDRPGTGWSDPGPFPRRTESEAVELVRLLRRAGEHGPFVLVGHGHGGLLAAGFARLHPDETAGVVLLDAAFPDMFAYAPAAAGEVLLDMARRRERQALAGLVGLARRPSSAAAAPWEGTVANDVAGAMRINARRPSAHFAAASIFREFGARKLTGAAPGHVAYDGELGDLPVWVVIPPEGEPLGLSLNAAERGDAEADRARRFIDRARLRYLAASTAARLVAAPAGTGHDLPYEAPDFVLEVVREAAAAARAGG